MLRESIFLLGPPGRLSEQPGGPWWGGGQDPQGGQRGENGRHGRSRSSKGTAARNHRRGRKIQIRKLEGVWTDSELTAGECVESSEIRKEQRWGVLRAEWNGETCTRGHNAQDRGSRYKRTTSGQVWKGTGTGRGIRLASLNIQTGRAVGMEMAPRCCILHHA